MEPISEPDQIHFTDGPVAQGCCGLARRVCQDSPTLCNWFFFSICEALPFLSCRHKTDCLHTKGNPIPAHQLKSWAPLAFVDNPGFRLFLPSWTSDTHVHRSDDRIVKHFSLDQQVTEPQSLLAYIRSTHYAQ